MMRMRIVVLVVMVVSLAACDLPFLEEEVAPDSYLVYVKIPAGDDGDPSADVVAWVDNTTKTVIIPWGEEDVTVNDRSDVRAEYTVKQGDWYSSRARSLDLTPDFSPMTDTFGTSFTYRIITR